MVPLTETTNLRLNFLNQINSANKFQRYDIKDENMTKLIKYYRQLDRLPIRCPAPFECD